mmetsp:Transcript_2051/g.5402  ORF Transcript_2051/g.5402 Transcript_2051/m.5402 type:complete len:215 (+) Transcript_2051:662-1306(+)
MGLQGCRLWEAAAVSSGLELGQALALAPAPVPPLPRKSPTMSPRRSSRAPGAPQGLLAVNSWDLAAPAPRPPARVPVRAAAAWQIGQAGAPSGSVRAPLAFAAAAAPSRAPPRAPPLRPPQIDPVLRRLRLPPAPVAPSPAARMSAPPGWSRPCWARAPVPCCSRRVNRAMLRGCAHGPRVRRCGSVRALGARPCAVWMPPFSWQRCVRVCMYV